MGQDGGVCALTPSLFGVPGRAMPRWWRRVNRHSRDYHRRLGHRHVGWRDRTSGDEQEPSHEHRDFDEHLVPFSDLWLSFYYAGDREREPRYSTVAPYVGQASR